MNTVVVGVGEGRTSEAAVQWAAAEADRRGWRLELLHAWQYPSEIAAGVGAWYPDDLLAQLDALAQETLEDAHTAVITSFPSLVVTSRLQHMHPRLALTKASEDARMIVTGARKHGALAGALLGSTGMHVAAHSRCPVAVVHGPPVPGVTGVVVGYDGSAAAEEALDFAAEEADAAGEELVILHASWPAAVVFDGFDAAGYVAREDRQVADERHRLERVATTVRSRRPGLAVRCELLVDEHASAGLVSAALAARLLVVGSRGHGAFASMLMGSTSRNVLQNAGTRVVVVPDRVRVAGSTPLSVSTSAPAEASPPVPRVDALLLP